MCCYTQQEMESTGMCKLSWESVEGCVEQRVLKLMQIYPCFLVALQGLR